MKETESSIVDSDVEEQLIDIWLSQHLFYVLRHFHVYIYMLG